MPKFWIESLLVVSIILSLLAFHNLDLSYNALKVGVTGDVSLSGKEFDIEEAHLNGLRTLMVSVIIIFLYLCLRYFYLEQGS
mgnify:CR=1 FL=1